MTNEPSPYEKYENIVPRVRTKNEILKFSTDLQQVWKQLPDSDDVYFVASFNYWHPIKMDRLVKKKILLRDLKAIQEKIVR